MLIFLETWLDSFKVLLNDDTDINKLSLYELSEEFSHDADSQLEYISTNAKPISLFSKFNRG